MTDAERIDELEETIQELQETINSLTEDNTSLEEAIDELREEVSEYRENVLPIVKRMDDLQYQMKKFVDMTYYYERNNDTLQVNARITREMIEYSGTDALDMLYANMKNEIMASVKKPYNYPNNIKYNPPAVW